MDPRYGQFAISVPWLQEMDFVIQSDTLEMARQAEKIDIKPIDFSDTDVRDLVAFMHALTGKTALKRPSGVPETVPSGFSVDR